MAPVLKPEELTADGQAGVARRVTGWPVSVRMVLPLGMEPQSPSLPGSSTSACSFGRLRSSKSHHGVQ